MTLRQFLLLKFKNNFTFTSIISFVELILSTRVVDWLGSAPLSCQIFLITFED